MEVLYKEQIVKKLMLGREEGVKKEVVEEIITDLLQIITSEVKKGNVVKLYNFGRFYTKVYNRTQFTCPHNGEKLTKPPRYRVIFKEVARVNKYINKVKNVT